MVEIPPNMLGWFIKYCIEQRKRFWIPIILRAQGPIAKQYFNKEFKLLTRRMQAVFINDFLLMHQPDDHKHILDHTQDCLGGFIN